MVRRRSPRQVGEQGEQLAASYLENLGWQILDRNWRCPDGELDIVARDDSALVFVEVKCRSGRGYGHPLEAITYRKAAKLRALARCWLRSNASWAPQVRIDAVGVLLPRVGAPELTHVRGVQPW
ncbi:MAG: YraN family protein [Propionibacterium sp.]|nr:MAG: YraN family protein [Propionibacterium sp.]